MKMRHIGRAISAIALMAVATSCSQKSDIENVTLGETSYHDSFLWSDADTTFLEKTVCLEFNRDAITQQSAVDITFTDNDKRTIPNSELQIIFDGNVAKNNTIRITPKSDSGKEEVKIKLRFLPGAQDGKHQGYMVSTPKGVENVNNIEIQQSGTPIMQWPMYFNHDMNPLKKGLLIALAVIVSVVILARLILHRRTFGSTAKKSVSVTDASGRVLYGPKTTRLGGYAEVRLCPKAEKQSFVNAFFFGKTLHVESPVFSATLRLTPGRRKEIKVAGGGYTILNSKMKYVDTQQTVIDNTSKNKIVFA